MALPYPASFDSICRQSRRVAVIGATPPNLTVAVALALAGAAVEVFGTISPFSGQLGQNLIFRPESLLEALATKETFFNDPAYLEAYPDVKEAVKNGDFPSGYDHYMIFGQHEGRSPGISYSSGLAEYDTLVFESKQWKEAEFALAGRVHTHHRIFVTGDAMAGSPESSWHVEFPVARIRFTPPEQWLGAARPAPTHRAYHNWPRVRRQDIYPSSRADGREWPGISVVIPSFNQSKYLEATLQSLLMQGYPRLELILIDGGSTDGSLDIIKKYEKHLTYWESAKDRGQSHAINKGFSRATGSILTWLNSDDRLAPNALFTVADAIARHGVDMVAGRCARIMDLAITPYHIHRTVISLNQVEKLPLSRLLDLDGAWLKGDFFHQPEVFFTRAILDRVGGNVREDLFYSMDYDLWVRFARAEATMLAIPEVLAIFRQHPNQKTGGDELPFLPELRQVNAEYKQSAA